MPSCGRCAIRPFPCVAFGFQARKFLSASVRRGIGWTSAWNVRKRCVLLVVASLGMRRSRPFTKSCELWQNGDMQ